MFLLNSIRLYMRIQSIVHYQPPPTTNNTKPEGEGEEGYSTDRVQLLMYIK
jgi:hypothetical protein